MRVFTEIEVTIADSKMKSLLEIYPIGFRRTGEFVCYLPKDDPRADQILNNLHRLGYKIHGRGYPIDHSHEYNMKLVRKYDNSDYSSVELLEVEGRPGWNEYTHVRAEDRDSETGQIPIPCDAIRPSADMASVNELGPVMLQIVISHRAKQRLDVSGMEFKHLVTRPTIIREPGYILNPNLKEKVYTFEEAQLNPWWEIDASFEMPPLSPTMNLMASRTKTPVQAGQQKTGLWRRDDPYRHAELHYSRSDIAKLPPFDAARTYERWGGYTQGTLILSRRFYQWWFAQGLNTKDVFVPVRIDEDL